jgi:hypothetical protein
MVVTDEISYAVRKQHAVHVVNARFSDARRTNSHVMRSVVLALEESQFEMDPTRIQNAVDIVMSSIMNLTLVAAQSPTEYWMPLRTRQPSDMHLRGTLDYMRRKLMEASMDFPNHRDAFMEIAMACYFVESFVREACNAKAFELSQVKDTGQFQITDDTLIALDAAERSLFGESGDYQWQISASHRRMDIGFKNPNTKVTDVVSNMMRKLEDKHYESHPQLKKALGRIATSPSWVLTNQFSKPIHN